MQSDSTQSDHSPSPPSSYNEPSGTSKYTHGRHNSIGIAVLFHHYFIILDFDPLPNRDQPNMFQNAPTSSDKDSIPSKLKRGRTFDDIREENRRQQMQQNFPRRDQWMESQQNRQEESESGSEQKSQGSH